MVEPGCEHLRSVGAEFALGVLPGRDRAVALAHLQDCPGCEQYVRDLTALGDRFVGLVPGAEPPVGFEQRVMDRLGLGGRPRRSLRRRFLLAAAAVLVAAGVGLTGWLARGGPGPDSNLVTAAVWAEGHEIGEAYAHTDVRSWVYVEVSSLPTAGPVICQIRLRDGRVITVGSFPVAGGAAQWGGPAPVTASLTELRILAPDGHIIGTAHFG